MNWHLKRGGWLSKPFLYFVSGDFSRCLILTQGGLVKPRGYPGDATLVDFAYGHGSIKEQLDHAGPVGQHIYACTSGAVQSASARQRSKRLTEKNRFVRKPSLSFESPHSPLVMLAN
jgi:hypothetical protein